MVRSKTKVLRKREKRLEYKKMLTSKTLVVTLVKSPIPASYSRIKVKEESAKHGSTNQRKRKSRKRLTGRKRMKLDPNARKEKVKEEVCHTPTQIKFLSRAVQ